MSRASLLSLLLLLACCLSTACDDGGGDDLDDPTPDAATDPGDAATDPGDAEPDAEPEPEPDAEPEPEPDAAPRPPLTGPLADYVAAPDDAYAWEVIDQADGPNYRAWKLVVTSQRWRTADEVDRPLWRHGVTVVVPDGVPTETALLVVSGGSEGGVDAPLGDLTLSLVVQNAVRAPVVLVEQIPSQPLVFSDVGERYSEDDLVAYSWRKMIDTGDATWPAYLPMTKAVVRAMDAVMEWSAETDGVDVLDFVVTGFSKRGATTWLVGAVDDRVRAIAPGVFDVLDMETQIERHFAAYGFYAPAIDSYVEQRVIEALGTPESDALLAVVDPIAYTERLTMPKLVITAAGDEFFLPDAAHLYLDALPGETLYRQFANTGHSMGEVLVDAVTTIGGWFRAVVGGVERPTLAWTIEPDALVLTADPPPTRVRVWTGTNPDARDFRFADVGAIWSSEEVEPESAGVYRVPLSAPAVGFTGHMVDVSFEVDGIRQVYGIPTVIRPDEFPFGDGMR